MTHVEINATEAAIALLLPFAFGIMCGVALLRLVWRSERAYLVGLADALGQAKRGPEPDEPEGSNYIRISDTLARQIEGRLRRITTEVLG